MLQLKNRLLIQKSKGPALLAKGSRLFVVLLLALLIAGNTPLVVLAQGSVSQQSKTTVKTVVKKPGFLQKLFSFLTAPFKIAAKSNNAAPKKVAINNVAPVKKPAPSPVPTPKVTPKPVPNPAVLAVSAANAVTTVIAKALPAGTTFIDLIGKTIIDSFGNVYPSGAGLAQTNKPTLGTTTNKYGALYLSNFNIDKAGKITTVLGGGIVKSSSAGVLSSSAVDINSGDITGTLQAGNGGTGQTTYTVGDILYSATGGTLSRLAIGTANQYLTVTSGLPSWSSALTVTSTSLADGSAATPALNFTNDSDSGLWRVGANHIALTTSGSAVSGISINGSGNLGIGTTSPNSLLAVLGGQVLGTSYGSLIAPTSGLLVQGLVGIGNTAPGNTLAVNGGLNLGTFASVTGPSNGLAVSGNIGIGVSTPNALLAVNGGGVFGNGYSGMVAPTNGLLVQGLVGIGNTAPGNTFTVTGGVNIGTYGTANGPSNGLAVSGNIGIGTTTPNSALSIVGGQVIGTGYGSLTAPTSGLLVQGLVGIGNTAPGNTLAVNGGLNLGTFASNTGITNGLVVSGNVGIGVTTANANLAIAGNAVIGAGYAGMLAPANGLAVEGLVGLGTTSPADQLHLIGQFRIDRDSSVTNQGCIRYGDNNELQYSQDCVTFTNFSNIGVGSSVGGGWNDSGTNINLINSTDNVGIGFSAAGTAKLGINGNVGIGTTAPLSALSVIGGAVFGNNYGSLTAPTSGLLIEGLVGIGNTAPGNTLAVNGGLNLGTFASVTGPSNGLAVSGNIGIGVSTPNALLAVNGGGVFGNGYSGMIAPTNGLLVQGLVGIGTTSPGAALGVAGAGLFGANFANVLAPTNGLAVQGNVGIGVSTANSILTVNGGAVIGTSYNLVAPTNGLLVQGLVGIGNTAPGNTFTVTGGVNIGTYGTANGPANGLAVSGNLGIGTTTPNSALSIVGGQVIGTGYGSLTAPTSGLLIEGLVGIGNTAPGNTLAVNGGLNLGTFASATGPSNGLAVSGNIGIGTTSPNYALDVTANIGVGTSANVVSALIAGSLGSSALSISGNSTLNTLTTVGNVGVGASVNTVSAGIFGSLGASALSISGNSTLNTLTTVGNVGVGASVNTVSAGIFGSLGAGALSISGSSTLNTLTTAGNVGIGGTATANSLSILSGGLSLAGTLTQSSGVILAPNGLVGAPSFSFTSSPNVGLWSPSANALSLTTNGTGTSGITVTAAGFVGVGTTAPAQLLQVGTTLGVDNSNKRIGIGTTSPNNALQVVGAGVFSNNWAGAVAPSAGLVVEGNTGIGTSAPSQALQVGTGMAFDSTNNRLGVGTTSPIATLNVWGSGSAASAIFQNGNVGIGGTATGFNTLQVTGSIGIGTSYAAGSYSLDVAGKVRATGYFGLCGSGTDATTCNQDVAEIYSSAEDVAAGDLVAIDSTNQKQVRKSQGSYDVRLMGIVSTAPGLVLGIDGANVALGAEASGYPENADPRLPAVALSGKVPVKVSTENGAINVGDYLTSSSIPGVAMKATKAGTVVGQALTAYDGKDVGKVLAFVRLGYYNGASLDDLSGLSQATGLDIVSGQTAALNFAQAVLARLISQQSTVGNMSDISLDRVAAGVEIITPKVTADTIILRSLQPLEGENMLLTLAADQKFVIQSTDKEEAVSFDSQGNAYFKGSIVATAIKADQIEGLKIMTNELVAGEVQALNEYLKSVKQASSSAQIASIDTGSLAKLGTDGGLTISGPAEFKAASIFNALADFIAGVVFRGDVSFLGRPTFNKDTAGLAIVGAGADSVRVNFERAYAQTPFVNITVTNADDAAQSQILNGEVRYIVTALSTSGFTIKINKAAPGAIRFSWSAIAVSNSAVSSSTGAASPTATPAPTAAPTASPVSTPAPTAAPTASPAPTAAPSAEPTAAPTAAPTASPEASSSATSQ